MPDTSLERTREERSAKLVHWRMHDSDRPSDRVDSGSAMQALKDALARPSGTPCTWRDDRDAYTSSSQSRFALAEWLG